MIRKLFLALILLGNSIGLMYRLEISEPFWAGFALAVEILAIILILREERKEI